MSGAGQSSPEWIGLILLVAVALAIGAATAATAATAAGKGGEGEGDGLGEVIAKRLACAADLRFSGCLDAPAPLVAAYGPALAETIKIFTPSIEYEKGMTAVPVDFRTCRRGPCSVGASEGLVETNTRGEPVTLFTRVIDCRDGYETPDADCTGDRAGHVYLGFWSYFTGSATGEGSFAPGTVRSLSEKLGKPTFHWDDFEHLMIRLPRAEVSELDRIAAIGTDPVRARARTYADARVSSHKGYAYSSGDPRRLVTDARADRPSWGPNLGRYGIYGGSHAGYIEARGSYIARQVRKAAAGRAATGLARTLGVDMPGWRSANRYTPSASIRLVPLETLLNQAGQWQQSGQFEVSPPWEKNAWFDGETMNTGDRPSGKMKQGR